MKKIHLQQSYYISYVSCSCLIVNNAGRRSPEGFPGTWLEAPTVEALLWVLGQHHGHPQADPGGTARDQHHFLPGTRHGNPAGSQSVSHLTDKVKDNKRIREAGMVTWVTWTTRLRTILVRSLLSFSFIDLVLAHNNRGFVNLLLNIIFSRQRLFKGEKRGSKHSRCVFCRHRAPSSGQ